MSIAFGIKALKCAGTSVSPRLLTIGSGVAPICSGVLDGFPADHGSDLLFGVLGDRVAVGGVVIAYLRRMVALIGEPVPTFGGIIAVVGRTISSISGAGTAVSRATRRCVAAISH